MEDTIAAIATPYGEGGIGIIRISGEESENILEKIFKPSNNKEVCSDSSRKLLYGHVYDPDSGEIIDEVLAVYMKGPNTYTCEDVVEIDCHGGIVPLRRILEVVFAAGARPAERGEFTKRAFLNGRIDLTQAEAVIDLVRAKADRSFDVAMDQLQGRLSESIKTIRAKLMDLLVELTVNIDYPDEDIEIITYERLKDGLEEVKKDIEKLISGSNTGRLISEGIRVAIIGKPNVGKSSLMNALLKESRAIVTDIPGTTRDTIEETLSISGIPVVLTDTAGIRETEDEIESIGIERSKLSFNKADLVLFMIDGSREISDEDRKIAEYVEPGKTVAVINKCDKEQIVSLDEVKALIPETEVIQTSLAEPEGSEVIEHIITDRVMSGETTQGESVTVTNARHVHLLKEARQSVSDALSLVDINESVEIIEIDVNQAYVSLGEIIGEAVGDDIIDEVFSRFCLGK